MIKLFFKKCKNRILYEIKHFSLWRYLVFPLGKKVYLIGTPEHGNMGDSATTIASMKYINKFISSKRIKEITKIEYREDSRFIKKIISKRALLCLNGGGNIGNQWYDEELIRYEIFSDFPHNKIIVFPQTAWFTKDSDGDEALKKAREYYNSINDLTVVAREKESYGFIKKQFSNAETILTPDIVLFTNKEDYSIVDMERKGALLVFRNDPERVLIDETKERIETLLKEKCISYKYTDTYSKIGLKKEDRFKRVQDKLMEFASSRIVITDRLHGMVFSAITETPCIVFSNYNYKVQGTYEWIKHLPYIRYVNNSDDIELIVNQLLSLKNCQYDNKTILDSYHDLSEEIKKYVD